MSLEEYKRKRNLNNTPEPLAIHFPRFCIQKHAARRLHYDFRLEYKGVLLSWAVPKGLSLDPKDKRLAIKVEDHPLEYQYFEGIIPKGNYGAGKVEIWDHGLFCTSKAKAFLSIEKEISEGLKKGHFNIILKGEKLSGEFVLQKLKKEDPDDASWLIIKKEDAYAISSISTKKQNQARSPMPEVSKPMLATLIQKPFNDKNWLFEIKWDGYRALAFIKHKNVILKSRSNIVWNEKFKEIVQALKKTSGEVLLDGELVILDNEGKANFQLMQNYSRDKQGQLRYYVFDLLYQDGQDLRTLPLLDRKQRLQELVQILSEPLICFSDHILEEGVAFFESAKKEGLEGIIGKEIHSTYEEKRSTSWVKIKTIFTQEVIIGGFTEPKGSRQKFGSLVVGIYNDKNEFVYVGHVGGGFTETLLQDVFHQLKPLIQKVSPFKNTPKTNAPVTWVKPTLVCEVAFTEWTQDDSLRHPIFRGLRIDKSHKEVKKETAFKITSIKPKNNTPSKSQKVISTQSFLTHLEKIYWPEEGYTKEDLINYYKEISHFILPYLKNRPITLHRFPSGIQGSSFYQKDLETHPDWIKTHPIKHEKKTDHYLLIEDLSSLLYAINLGSIDVHPFMSQCDNLEHPDYCVIDLDPHDISFEKAIEVAITLHEILSFCKIPHYCKTSGGKGLHVFIPLHGKYTYHQSQQFAEVIAFCVHKKLSDITSLERSSQKRKAKIYLDCLQNRSGQTIVAPYAVRPRAHALVSTPLLWEELKKGLHPEMWTIKSIPARLKELGDIFKPVLEVGINMPVALNRLKKLL